MLEFCQSCGLPLSNRNPGTEKDGQPSSEYCGDCYKLGSFTQPDMTLNEMIEYWIPSFLKKGFTEMEARSILESSLPGLNRWNKTESQPVPPTDESSASQETFTEFTRRLIYDYRDHQETAAAQEVPGSVQDEPIITEPANIGGVEEIPAKPGSRKQDTADAATIWKYDTDQDIQAPEIAFDRDEEGRGEPPAADKVIALGPAYSFDRIIPPSPEPMLPPQPRKAGPGQTASPTQNLVFKQESTGKRVLKRLLTVVGSLLLLISLGIVLAPFVGKYWEQINPFSTVQPRPDLPVATNGTDGSKNPQYRKATKDQGGYLEIPKLNLALNVVYGVGPEELEKGPGIYPQSGMPDSGNMCIAGHRNTAGSPFLKLNELTKGDTISFKYGDKTYKYTVDSVFITNETDWSVIDPTPQPALTLTTCDPVIPPADGKYDRLIVRAYLQSSP